MQANQKSFEDILQQQIKNLKSGKSITPAEVISALAAGAGPKKPKKVSFESRI